MRARKFTALSQYHRNRESTYGPPGTMRGHLTGSNRMPTLKATTLCWTLLSWSSLCFAADPAGADSSDMKARIEQMRKRLESERALPEEQRWALDENHVNNLEERAQDGDTQAAQFLELARDRISRLRRERFIKKWGRALNDPDAADELRVHAKRTAELKQVRLLALSKNYPAVVGRADELIFAERTRFEKRMEAIMAELRGEMPSEPVSANPVATSPTVAQ